MPHGHQMASKLQMWFWAKFAPRACQVCGGWQPWSSGWCQHRLLRPCARVAPKDHPRAPEKPSQTFSDFEPFMTSARMKKMVRVFQNSVLYLEYSTIFVVPFFKDRSFWSLIPSENVFSEKWLDTSLTRFNDQKLRKIRDLSENAEFFPRTFLSPTFNVNVGTKYQVLTNSLCALP